MSHFKRYFFAGLWIILPIFITIYLLWVVFRFVDGIWGKVINHFLLRNFGFSIPGLGFILGMLTILLVGFVATNFFGKKLVHLFEKMMIKFPIIGQIYGPAKQIVDSFISHEKPAFKSVAMVEYPSKGIWSIGFITNESFEKAESISGEPMYHIFIATTPSPLTGFLILVPKKDVKVLDMPIEDGVKLIVSGGIVKP